MRFQYTASCGRKVYDLEKRGKNMDNIKKRNSLFSSMFIFCTIVSMVGICEIGNASPPKSFLSADAILEAWESNYGGIKTMQVSYTERVLDAKNPTTDPNRLDTLVRVQHVERLEEGKRYHIRYSTAEDGFTKPENIMEHAFDGKITREYWGMENLGTINPGLMGTNVETMNHQKMYMLLTPIQSSTYREEFPNGIPIFSQILRTGISSSLATVRPNLEPVAGQSCHVVEITNNGEITNKIWIAHDKGMLPLKYQSYNNNKLTVEIEVEQIARAETERGDIWYPVKAHRTVNSISRGTTIKYELTTKVFVPNVKVDENTFRINFPNGTHVLDRELGLEYVAGVK